MKIPDPKALFANEYLTSCFIKNVVKASHVKIGEYTYYDDEDAIHFEKIISYLIILNLAIV